MRIGIDARLIGESGVGRYIRNLIRELSSVDRKNTYVIFLTKEGYKKFRAPNHRFTCSIADVRWHTLKEQLIMPWICMREHLDVLHVPYFNAPVLYPGKFLLTIHDLTIRYVNTGLASTYPKFLYMIRRMGYHIVLLLGLRRAGHIITVSHAVKHDIMRDFSLPSGKISVTYEGVDPGLLIPKKTAPLADTPYFLYVGNAYPHKNLPVLLDGYHIYASRFTHPYTLVLVGRRDYFYSRIAALVTTLNLSHLVRLFGAADDNELRALYTHARALVFPSRMEGFGLPAIEALMLGCPVICSDIPVFRELLGTMATYVDTNSAFAVANALAAAHNRKSKPVITQKQKKSLGDRYSWRRMAKDTVSLYEKVYAS